ncbi:methyltransferase [Streptomyces rectiverticillatus]|uniref:protein-L-isoaspartate O-methyltransferase family protein n=1 Tax=Streptomyces rectiverticillatus TaxID=173860 RepID=UPI0015C2C98B|nr:methyltransferase [Streptomyces rectiverticillatus]QLE70317.1 methyltransferase [Streptomyces rectiverticillatus]
MKTSPAAPAAHLGRLLADVTEPLGRQLPPEYERALRTVPRHLFLPDRLWLRDGDGGYRPCDRSTNPDGWITAAYTDTPLVTRFTDGLPSSSASMPSMVLRTLLLAGIGDAAGGARPRRVLELGTGTGFNAALLCAVLGDDAVSTVELDPLLAAQGERNLEAAGFAPAVSCGDAAAGWPPGAPYERVVATFSVDRVPPAWVEQTTAGGRIVTPWTSAWCRYGTLALTVGRNGTAHGRFHAFASFMPMRRPCRDTAGPATAPAPQRKGATSLSPLSPWLVAGGDLDAEFHLGLAVPGASFAWDTSGEHAPTRLHIADDEGPSWAAVDYDGHSADRFTVTQAGPRLLWDEITAGYTHWETLGRPRIGQYRLSVNTAGDHTVQVETGRGRPGITILGEPSRPSP